MTAKPPSPMRSSSQFTKILYQVSEPTAGFDMWVGTWSNNGNGHVVIGAPSLEALGDRWLQIVGVELDRSMAQHVIAVQCAVPEELLGDAKCIAHSSGADPK